MKTLISILLDESGSMYGSEKEVIDGYNNLLAEQMSLNSQATISLIKFGSKVTVVYSNRLIQSAPKLDQRSYDPDGNTALFDAVGDGISLIDANKQPEDNAVVVVITDGEEFGSLRFTKEQIKQLIADRKAAGNWSFIYVGPSPDAFANEMGISPNTAISYETGKIKANISQASETVTGIRSNKLKASPELLNNVNVQGDEES